jgi:hypothetical protein
MQDILTHTLSNMQAIAAQGAMKAGYGAAFEAARGKPGAAEAYARIEALPERSEGISSRGRQV